MSRGAEDPLTPTTSKAWGPLLATLATLSPKRGEGTTAVAISGVAVVWTSLVC